jgi:hypothetical protein
MAMVLLREDGTIGSNAPVNRQSWVVERETAIMDGTIVIGDLVNHFGVGLDRAKTMGKADWNPELLPILGRKDGPHMLPERRRTNPNINRYIHNRAANYLDKLGLGLRWSLEVQAAHGPDLTRKRMIALNEVRRSNH